MEDRCYRSTVSNIPEDQAKLRNSAVPVFFSVEFERGGAPVPQVTDPLVRCVRCKGYLNPYVEVIMPGVRWRCNLCGAENETSSPFSMRGRATTAPAPDAVGNAAFNRTYFVRDDLCHDIYEIEAPDSFVVRTPDAPVLCFIVDVALEAQKLCILGAVLGAVRETLRTVDYDRRTRACLMFYNEAVHVLNRNGTLSVIAGAMPRILPEAILFPLEDFAAAVDIPKLERCFSAHRSLASDILRPLHLAATAFRSASLFIFFATMPCSGDARLTPSADLVCRNSAYREAADTLFRKNICANLFLMARAGIEYATIGVLSQKTGGQTFHYPNFDGGDPSATAKLFCDLTDHFARNVGFGAVARVRASEGAVLKAVYGNFTQKAVDLLGFANWNPSHSINFTLTLFNSVPRALFLQIAMIRVDRQGRRLIRVFNICVPVAGGAFYDGCDPNAITHALLLEAFYHEGRRRGGGAEHIHRTLRSIWRELRAAGSVPPALQRLPGLVLAARKSIPLRPDPATPSDFRAFYIYLFSNGSPMIVDRMLYPLLLCLSDTCVAPRALTFGSLNPAGLFLLDTGVCFFFFAGAECASVSELFAEPRSGPVLFSPPESELGRYVSELVAYLVADRPFKPRFVLVVDSENSIYSSVFYSYLYDDRMHSVPAIDEYQREIESC